MLNPFPCVTQILNHTTNLTFNNNNNKLSQLYFPLYRIFILIFMKKNVPSEYSVAAILFLLFMLLISIVPVLNLL